MIPAAFEYAAPKNVNEALAMLRQHPDAKVMAGGQSLLSLMKLRAASPPMVVDLGRIRDLSYIREEKEHIAIGALTTHTDIERSPVIQKRLKALAESAEQIGDLQVRNRGTIGGSLAHADPAADYPAAFLALEGSIVAQGAGGTRTIAADQFFTGLFSTALKANEILTEVRFPTSPAISGSAYRKMKHPASGFAVIGAGAVVRAGGQLRLAFTGAAAHAFRAKTIETALSGKKLDEATVRAAMEQAAQGVDLLEDLFADKVYRAQLVKVYGRRAVLAAVQ
jgi:carbon-monoxide dehydrogenase medium subunit